MKRSDNAEGTVHEQVAKRIANVRFTIWGNAPKGHNVLAESDGKRFREYIIKKGGWRNG